MLNLEKSAAAFAEAKNLIVQFVLMQMLIAIRHLLPGPMAIKFMILMATNTLIM